MVRCLSGNDEQRVTYRKGTAIQPGCLQPSMCNAEDHDNVKMLNVAEISTLRTILMIIATTRSCQAPSLYCILERKFNLHKEMEGIH